MTPISFSTFGVILSEVQDSFRKGMSWVVLFPLGLSIAILTWISARVYGWTPVETFWSERTELEKALLAIAAVFGLVMLAYLLDAMQGVVSRFFLGIWLRGFGWLSSIFQANERAELLMAQEQDRNVTSLWSTLRNASDALWGTSTKQPVVVVAKRDMSRFHTVADADLDVRPEPFHLPGTSGRKDAFTGRLLLDPVRAGSPLLASRVLRATAERVDEPNFYVPVSIARGHIPDAVGVGSYVRIFDTSPATPEPVGAHALLVVAVDDPGLSKDGSPDRPVTLTLAVPQSVVSDVVSHADPEKLTAVLDVVQAEDADRSSRSLERNRGEIPNPFPTGLYSAVERDIEWLRGMGNRSLLDMDEDVPERVMEIGVRCGELYDVLQRDLPPERRRPFLRLRKELSKSLEQALEDIVRVEEQLHRKTRLGYPALPSHVSATRTGNVMNAVRGYAYQVYGIDLDVTLPRIQRVIDEASAERLRTAQERVHLLQWTWIFAVITAFAGAGIAFYGGDYAIAFWVWVIAFGLAWLIWSRALPGVALGYAEHLRTVIDTERGKILASLGVQVTDPLTLQDEKRIWEDIGQWWEYGAPPKPYTLVGAPIPKGEKP